MAYEDFTTYTEVDEGGNVTVTTNKVSWVDLDTDETSFLYKDMTVDFFDGDFTHKFECQVSGRDAGNPLFAYWMVANDIGDIFFLINNSNDFIFFTYFYSSVTGNNFELTLWENGAPGEADVFDGPTDGVTYYVTISRDDDGGANNTGQIKAYIRTGSHSGSLVDTLSVDCAAGEQNDYRYIYALCSYDESAADEDASGHTERLDLSPVILIAGTADGTSTTACVVNVNKKVAGSADGTSTASASFILVEAIAGSAAGTSTAACNVLIRLLTRGSEIITQVRDELQDNTAQSCGTNELLRYINRGAKEFCATTGCLQQEFAIPTSGTDYRYKLSTHLNNSVEIISLEYNGTPISRTYKNEVLYRFGAEAGIPFSWYEYEGMVYTDLIPPRAAGSSALVAFYLRTPTVMSASTDVFDFPKEWESAIVSYAIARCLIAQRDTEIAETYMSKYESLRKEALTSNKLKLMRFAA